jgi:hypothetical protein
MAPDRPGRESIRNPDGTLKDIYKTESSQKMIEALLAEQGLQEQQGRDQAVVDNNQSLAAARSSGAMRGGLRSGQQERMNSQGMRDLNASLQNVGMQGREQRLNLQSKGQETDYQARNQDVGRMVQDVNAQNAFNQDVYGQDMQAYAAKESGRAMQLANKGKGQRGGIGGGLGSIAGK